MIYVMVRYVWWIDIAMIRYVEGMLEIYYVIVMIYDIWHDMIWIVMFQNMVTLWYNICVTWMIWLTCKTMN